MEETYEIKSLFINILHVASGPTKRTATSETMCVMKTSKDCTMSDQSVQALH